MRIKKLGFIFKKCSYDLFRQEFCFMRGFQNVGNFTCVTLQIKEEELMLKYDIHHWASDMEHIHQTSYLHVDIGFSYYLIVDFGECLLNRCKVKW